MPERINRVMENIKAFWVYLASVGTVGVALPAKVASYANKITKS